MTGRNLLAAVLLVLLAYAVSVGADADAAASWEAPAIDCEAWAHGATTPAVVAAICRREAMHRNY
jgi:hypothetical protein